MTNLYYNLMCQAYPHFKECSVQTFDDNQTEGHKKDEGIVTIIDQRKFNEEQMEGMLTRLNGRGAGIYFSVNSMKEFEGEGTKSKMGNRDKQSTVRLNAWMCDIDGRDKKKGERRYTKEEQLEIINSAPIVPSMMVESCHGFHLYWFMKDGNDVTEENIEQWQRICWGICTHFKGDTKLPNDYARVLRIPGFFHKKDPNNPFECSVAGGTQEYYSSLEMSEAYPNRQQAKDKDDEAEKIYREHKQFMATSDGAWYNINALDNIDMLYEISGMSCVRGERFDFKRNNSGYQIIVDGKSSSCWIDRNGLIGSYDGGGPTRVNRIKYYKVRDEKDIYKYVKEKHPECIPEKKQELDVIMNKIDELTDKGKELSIRDKSYFELPAEIFDKLGGLISGELGVIVAEPNSGKTTFAMDLMIRNSKKHKSMYINMEFEMRVTLESRWLSINGKTKRDLTKDGNMTDEERKSLEGYVKENLGKFDYVDAPQGLELDELVDMVIGRSNEGYELFVIDTLSRIRGNLTKDSHSNQNKCMEVLQALCQKLQVTIILIHHTNKQGTFEGSQKIMDLANFFLVIEKDEDMDGYPKRIYHLKKDKYTPAMELELYYSKGEYTEIRPDTILPNQNNQLKFGEMPL